MANHQLSFNKNDIWFTREYAIEPIVKYIKSGSIIWCPFDKDDSNFVKVFKAHGFSVINSHIETGQNFFDFEPEKYDVIVSNPPYSLREKIMERLFALEKPFAMLINMTGLFDSKKRFNLLSTRPFEFLIFDRRIVYKEDKSPPYLSVYFCSGVLPSVFVFERLAHLTPLALDGGDSAASKQFPTPEVLSTLQGESTPAHRK